MESLVTGAKKEDELVFVAGAQTFGGRKGLSELEAAFNKRFGLNMNRSGNQLFTCTALPFDKDIGR